VLKFRDPRSIQEALDEAMPTELFELYETIMSRITVQNDSKLALQTLSWVLYAKRLLFMDELREAAAIREGDRGLNKEYLPSAKTLVEICGSFIIYDERSGVVQLAHETVKEFLTLRHSGQLPSERIAKMCLAYLSFDVFDSPCTDKVALDTRVRKYGLCQYAAQFWGPHTRGEAESFPHIQQSVLSLLASENRRNSIGQMAAYNPFSPSLGMINNETLLQIIAAEGLVTTCRLVLLGQTLTQSSRYTLFIPWTLTESSWEDPSTSLIRNFSPATNISAKDKFGRTALSRAAAQGHKEIVQLLLEKDADVNACGERCGSALIAASEQGYEEIVRFLLENGADVNGQGGKYGSALVAASSQSHEEIVRFLLDNGADVNAQLGGLYGSALMAGSSHGHEEIVRLLLDNGADVNAQLGRPYGSPLVVASFQGHEEIVRLLLENGADLNAQRPGRRYGVALIAASGRGHRKVVQLLLDNGADLDALEERFNGSALTAASRNGHEELVRLFLGYGANIDAPGGFLGNALMAASSEGHKEIVRLLLENGANVNAQEGILGNALTAASREGHEEIVRLLLEKGADVNAQTPEGRYGNALMAASAGGDGKVVQLLLDNGADINAQVLGEFDNALDAALKRGHDDVVRLLENWQGNK
jgi:ankyrin repeat protein